MALKQAEQARLESLNQTVGILAGMSLEAAVIKEKTKEMAQSLEQDTNSKLELVSIDGQMQYKLIDLRSDFIRTRYNTDKSMLSLRTKVFSLPIEVKVIKNNDDLHASNAQVAESLRELANVVEGMPVEMTEQGKADWSRVPGEMPKSLSDDGTDDGDDESAKTEVSTATQTAAQQNVATENQPATQSEATQQVTNQASQAPVQEAPAATQQGSQLPDQELPGDPIDNQVGESLT